MIGIDRDTGRALTGWDHVVQSLNVLFTTRYVERVMLRWFGTDIPKLLLQPMNEPTILEVFYAALVGIELWEPRFRVVDISITQAEVTGHLSFNFTGIYYPRGQNGDFTSSMRKTLVVLARSTGLTALPGL